MFVGGAGTIRSTTETRRMVTELYFVHLQAGGVIGPHPAGFDQLFLVTSGSGWVAGPDGSRQSLSVGQGAVIACGEVHSKGSAAGLSAIMIQIERCNPSPFHS